MDAVIRSSRRVFLCAGTLLLGCDGDPKPARVAPAASQRPAPSTPPTRDQLFERTFFPPPALDLFERKHPPQPGDWLAEHYERGQSFAAYRGSDPVRPTGERSSIVLQPLGPFDDRSILDQARDYAARFFTLPVRVEKAVSLPKRGRRIRNEGGRRWTQHETPRILSRLSKRLPDDAVCYLGITMEDLYPKSEWNFVFGQASLVERVGVYSLARFQPAFEGKPDSPAGRRLALRRSLHLLAHETGHMFSMAHCIDFECVMNGSNSLEEADRQSAHLCPICLHKLSFAIGFDARKRYRALAEFYRSSELGDLAEWVERRLRQIEQPG